MKLKCIKECIMIQDGSSTTTVGKIYETVGDYIYIIMIIDDEGDFHGFNKENDEHGLSYKEWFEEVKIPKKGGAVMELTAEEARKIVKSVNEKLVDPYNDFYEVYAEIRTEAAHGKTFVEIEYLRPEEFKILDQAGFKIYTKDGKSQLTKPEAVEGVMPIVIDWE